jgi:hypothetical protein
VRVLIAAGRAGRLQADSMAKKLEQAALDGNGPTYVSRDNQTIEVPSGAWPASVLCRRC